MIAQVDFMLSGTQPKGLPVAHARAMLREAFSPLVAAVEADQLVKKWPLVIINSATPQEAVAYLQRHLQEEPALEIIRFAHEVHAASRFVMFVYFLYCHVLRGFASRFVMFETLHGSPLSTRHSRDYGEPAKLSLLGYLLLLEAALEAGTPFLHGFSCMYVWRPSRQADPHCYQLSTDPTDEH